MYIEWAILTHIFDLWPWRMTLTFNLTTQNVQLHEIHMHAMRYQVAIFNIAKGIKSMLKFESDFDPYIWPLTLKDLDLDLLPLKMCSSMRYTCMPNIKLLSSILQKVWPMLKFERFWPIYLTFDLEGWPWPWPFNTKNVQLYEIHMHAKYQVAIFNIAKVMANVKVCANQQTNKQTDRAKTIKSAFNINTLEYNILRPKRLQSWDHCHNVAISDNLVVSIKRQSRENKYITIDSDKECSSMLC